MASDLKQIAQITANNVALRDQYIVVGGETLRLPQREELLAYLANVRAACQRWADQPAAQEPLFEQAATPDAGPDAYLPVDARPLPMRVAEFRGQPTGQAPPAQELLAAVGNAHCAVILGEPGSGKTTALERLAWVSANASLDQAANGADLRLTLPILARLADYQGEADLLPMLRRVLSRGGLELTTELAVRATLQATDAHFVLLLDGLNELSRTHAAAGLRAIQRHMDEFFTHTVHLTCRTADFDQAQAAAVLPATTQLWEVQPLADSIRYWGDPQGESDVRDYLRRHLGEARGSRLYARLQADDRLQSLARLPLFLFMLKETAGDGAGELPANRGDLVRRFVRSDRLLLPVPLELRSRLERSLEGLAWRMEQAGVLELTEEALYDELAAVRGRRDYALDDDAPVFAGDRSAGGAGRRTLPAAPPTDSGVWRRGLSGPAGRMRRPIARNWRSASGGGSPAFWLYGCGKTCRRPPICLASWGTARWTCACAWRRARCWGKWAIRALCGKPMQVAWRRSSRRWCESRRRKPCWAAPTRKQYDRRAAGMQGAGGSL